jgi:ABC-2 type transport system ATP-binding protein
MIRVEDLYKSYGQTVALEGVSFEVHPGEVVGLLGPNGAGKTSCLRVLTCFVQPSAGSVRINDLDPTRDSLEIRRQVGYLPESCPLHPELRVSEYLTFRARLRGITRRGRREAIERVMRGCGLEEVQRRIVGQLSRGFRQRLGLADALLGAPRVLILDEPTAGLDPNQIREVRRLIRNLTADGDHTVLLSTHILSEVEALCSRAVILHRGRLVDQGPVDQLRTRFGEGITTVQVRIGDGDEQGLIDALERLPAVARVEIVERGGEGVVRCRLHGEMGPEARERVAELISSNPAWALQALGTRGADLEEIFARLTRDEETTATEA